MSLLTPSPSPCALQDQFAAPDYISLYGTHPYFVENRGGQVHGVFSRNAAGQDWILQGDTLTANIIGGIVDLFVFAGPTFHDVQTQYAQIIGTSILPPYWSLGFHQCHFGYLNLSMVETSVKGYNDAQIPLDVMYTDIDYMDRWRTFTHDESRFPLAEWSKYIEELRGPMQKKYILIFNPTVAMDNDFEVRCVSSLTLLISSLSLPSLPEARLGRAWKDRGSNPAVADFFFRVPSSV